MKYIVILVIAVLLDYFIGDPISWPHPIIYVGKLISWLEKIIRKQKIISLKIGGFLLVLLTLMITTLTITLIIKISIYIHPIFSDVIYIYLIYTSLAATCLRDETMKVYYAVKDNNLQDARKKLSYLVGRDTTDLSMNEILRANIETIAENTIDGVLAPLFYIFVGMILGIPVQLVFIYKAINTLDSMVGYIQEPYKDIGYASAKLDDILNYIPARIGSVFMLLSGIFLRYDASNGLKILKRDKRNHKSPNCAYPESVVAGLLKIQLGGTNTYFGEILYKPTIGDDLQPLNVENIKDTINIMYVSEILMVIAMVSWLVVS